MSAHHLPLDNQTALQEEMEQSRINFERWRQIHRRAGHTLREEYPDKHDNLARDEVQAEVVGDG